MAAEKEPEPPPALAKLRINLAVLSLSDLAELRAITVHHAPPVDDPGPKPVFTNDQMVWWTIRRECEDQLATRIERYRGLAVDVLKEDKERAESDARTT